MRTGGIRNPLHLMPMVLAVVVCVILVAAMGFSVHSFLDSQESLSPEVPLRERPKIPDYLQKPRPDLMDRLARKSKGDLSRLSPEEQRWLDTVTAGHGAMMLAKKAHDLLPPPKVAAGPPAPPSEHQASRLPVGTL